MIKLNPMFYKGVESPEMEAAKQEALKNYFAAWEDASRIKLEYKYQNATQDKQISPEDAQKLAELEAEAERLSKEAIGLGATEIDFETYLETLPKDEQKWFTGIMAREMNHELVGMQEKGEQRVQKKSQIIKKYFGKMDDDTWEKANALAERDILI